jgi:hypothetical protein
VEGIECGQTSREAYRRDPRVPSQQMRISRHRILQRPSKRRSQPETSREKMGEGRGGEGGEGRPRRVKSKKRQQATIGAKVHFEQMPTLHLTAAPGCMGLRSRFFSCFLLVGLCCPHGRGDRGKYYAVPSFELVLLLDDVLFRSDCQNQRIEQLRNPYETVSMQAS